MSTFVLGDLSKSEAHRYFLQLISTLEVKYQELFKLDDSAFEEIFFLTGGRMFLIEEYVCQVIESSIRTRIPPSGMNVAKIQPCCLECLPVRKITQCATVDTFKPIMLAKAALIQKLYSSSDKPYTKQNVFKVMEAIVHSKCGYVPFQTLADLEEVGFAQLVAMIEENIVYYRPQSAFYTDLEPAPCSAVVTAAGAHALRAMEALIATKRSS